MRTLIRIMVVAFCATVSAIPSRASMDKLQETRVPLFYLLIDAFEKEGENYNITNDDGSLPSFHSVQWNPAERVLEWRFWVTQSGTLPDQLRTLSRRKAVALLKEKMKDLAVFVGLEPFPGLNSPLGCLATVRIPGEHLMTEAEWAAARKEIAAACVIRLAAPHADGPICLTRRPNGRIEEEDVSKFEKEVDKKGKERQPPAR